MAKSWEVFRITDGRIRCIFCGHEEDLPAPVYPPIPIGQRNTDPVYRAMVAFYRQHRACHERMPAVIAQDRRGGQETEPYPLAEEWEYESGRWDSDRGRGARELEWLAGGGGGRGITTWRKQRPTGWRGAAKPIIGDSRRT